MKSWKNLVWEESFILSGFWGFGAFSENLLNARQRASIKVSTVTSPQTMLVAPLLQPRLRRVTARHAFSPGLTEGWGGWGGKEAFSSTQTLHPLHHIAHHPQLSPARLLLPSSHPEAASRQQKLLGR